MKVEWKRQKERSKDATESSSSVIYHTTGTSFGDFLIITMLASDRKHLVEGLSCPPLPRKCTTPEPVMVEETSGFLLLLLLL